METKLITYYFKKATEGQLTEEEVRKVVETWNNKNTDKFLGLGAVGFVLRDGDGYFRMHCNQILIACENEVNGFRTFYTEKNIKKILDYMSAHDCYGIIGTVEMSDSTFEEYKHATKEMDNIFNIKKEI